MKGIVSSLTSFILPVASLTATEPDPPAAVGIERGSEVWWFQSPAGQRFLSIGINHGTRVLDIAEQQAVCAGNLWT